MWRAGPYSTGRAGQACIHAPAGAKGACRVFQQGLTVARAELVADDANHDARKHCAGCGDDT